MRKPKPDEIKKNYITRKAINELVYHISKKRYLHYFLKYVYFNNSNHNFREKF